MSFALSALLRGVETSDALPPIDVEDVRDDSRQVRAGDLFVAVPGVALDGRRSPADPRFLADAAARGARVLVTEGDAPAGFAGVVVRVARARLALGIIAANRFGAAAALSLHAITGTNGKTTMTYLVEGMLRAAGRVPGVIGTIESRAAAPGFAPIPSSNTTPGSLALQSTLADMRAAGTTDVVLEATSHALDQDRLAGCSFRVAALTNVTQDHLDYHGTMERYFDAKALLFERLLHPSNGIGVVPVDKEEGARMRARCRRPTIGVATRAGARGADVVAGLALLDAEGTRVAFETPRGPVKIASPLVGDFNLENLALAVGVGIAADLPVSAIETGLAGVAGVPGRLERVPNDRGVLCVVDYAHTPDALERALAAVRSYARGQLIVVFGCGGDRDRGKRPIMGSVAAKGATLSVVTSDNPRTEDPDAIVDMIIPGLEQGGAVSVSNGDPGRARLESATRCSYHREVDRRAAIRFAIAAATDGDVVLIAGKGHEDYQIVGATKTHFDDREEAAAAFAAGATAKAES